MSTIHLGQKSYEVPKYYRERARVGEIKEYLRATFKKHKIEWDEYIDELMERVKFLHGCIAAESMEAAVRYRLQDTEEVINRLLEEHPGKKIESVKIAANVIELHCTDKSVLCYGPDFTVKHRRI